MRFLRSSQLQDPGPCPICGTAFCVCTSADYVPPKDAPIVARTPDPLAPIPGPLIHGAAHTDAPPVPSHQPLRRARQPGRGAGLDTRRTTARGTSHGDD